MNNFKLAQKIFLVLKGKGAEIGNASVVIIEDVLDKDAELAAKDAVIEAVKTKIIPFLKNVQDDLYCDNDGRGCGCNSEAEKLEAEIVSILA